MFGAGVFLALGIAVVYSFASRAEFQFDDCAFFVIVVAVTVVGYGHSIWFATMAAAERRHCHSQMIVLVSVFCCVLFLRFTFHIISHVIN